MLLEEGERAGSVKNVAEKLGIKPQTLSVWRMSPLWRARYQQEREEWEANLRDVPISSARYRQQRRQKELDRLEECRYTAESLAEVSAAARATDQILTSAAKEVQGVVVEPAEGARAVHGSFVVESQDPQEARRAFAEYVRYMAEDMGLMDEPVRVLVERLGAPQLEA